MRFIQIARNVMANQTVIVEPDLVFIIVLGDQSVPLAGTASNRVPLKPRTFGLASPSSTSEL